MSCSAAEGYAQMLHSQHRDRTVFAIRGMRHHCGIHAVESTTVEQRDFPSSTLLRGSTHQNYPSRKFLHNRVKPDRRGKRRTGNQIVTAGMTIGQSVVFGENCDCRT